jgi:hypothetical protein
LWTNYINERTNVCYFYILAKIIDFAY